MSINKTKAFIWKDFKFPLHHNYSKARDQSHQAAQLLAATARAFLDKKDDDSQAAMIWNDKAKVLSTQKLSHATYPYVVLNIADLSIGFMQEDGNITQSLSLHGETLQSAIKQISSIMNIDTISLSKPYELPELRIGISEAFDKSQRKSLLLCEKIFENAYNAILPYAQAETSIINIWPHHFDIASLLTYQAKGEKKFIGIGLSPGDINSSNVYFYINTWPYPKIDTKTIEPLKAGLWQTEGWTGAILNIDEIINSDHQEKTVQDFLSDGFNRIRALMFP